MQPFAPGRKRFSPSTSEDPNDESAPKRARVDHEKDHAEPSDPLTLSSHNMKLDLHDEDLTPQQKEAIDLMVSQRKNVYLTGSAGSGKSSLIRYVATALQKQNACVVKTGPTGRAACNIDGMTLHSFCGWAPQDAMRKIEIIERKAEAGLSGDRFRDTDVLIIDEISMVSNHMFEKLNRAMKVARRDEDHAFGGCQMIVCGDFCQLPPVKPFETCFYCGKNTTPKTVGRSEQYDCLDCQRTEYDEDKWAFSAQAWEEADFKNIYLEENHRQHDPNFIRILETVRLRGRLTYVDSELLKSQGNRANGAIKLFPRRKEVRRVNESESKKLTSEVHRYKCLDYFWSSPKHPDLSHRGQKAADGTLKYIQAEDHPYEKFIELKIGMPVLLLTNLDVGSGLINGAQGRVVGFEDYDEAKLERAKSGATYKEVDSRDARLQNLIHVRGGELFKLCYEQVIAFIDQPVNRHRQWPIVKFANAKTVTVYADPRIDQLGHEPPFTLEGRTQVPLMPVWAMTIHKAQGMSLQTVQVSLKHRFAAGQAYVALSRATALEGLKLENMGKDLSESDVDQRVRRFHAETRWDIGRVPVLQ